MIHTKHTKSFEFDLKKSKFGRLHFREFALRMIRRATLASLHTLTNMSGLTQVSHNKTFNGTLTKYKVNSTR